MKYKMAALVLGLWIGASWNATVFAADANAGKAVFEKSCAGCHGKDGKGNPAMAKALGAPKGLDLTTKETAQKSDDDLLKVISQGSGKMPAAKISKDEQKEVLAYIHTLAK